MVLVFVHQRNGAVGESNSGKSSIWCWGIPQWTLTVDTKHDGNGAVGESKSGEISMCLWRIFRWTVYIVGRGDRSSGVWRGMDFVMTSLYNLTCLPLRISKPES